MSEPPRDAGATTGTSCSTSRARTAPIVSAPFVEWVAQCADDTAPAPGREVARSRKPAFAALWSLILPQAHPPRGSRTQARGRSGPNRDARGAPATQKKASASSRGTESEGSNRRTMSRQSGTRKNGPVHSQSRARNSCIPVRAGAPGAGVGEDAAGAVTCAGPPGVSAPWRLDAAGGQGGAVPTSGGRASGAEGASPNSVRSRTCAR